MGGATGSRGNPFRRVVSGEQMILPSAPVWNAMLDAVESSRRGPRDTSHPLTEPEQSGIIHVVNDSGGTLDRFAVVGLDGPRNEPDGAASPDPFLDYPPVLTAVTPTTALHQGKFAVLLEGLADGDVGLACIHGVCQVKLDLVSEDHRFADVTDGDATQLTSCLNGGAEILYYHAGTSWAIVRIIGHSRAPVLEDIVLNCCSEEFAATFTGATSGGESNQSADLDFPVTSQTQWEALRATTFSLLTDTAGNQAGLQTGGLGRFGVYDEQMKDEDTLTVNCHAYLANNLEFHFDTSGVGDKPVRRAVLYLYTSPDVAPGGTGVYPETFHFAVRKADGTLLASFDANTPGRIVSTGWYAFQVELPVDMIVADGDTDLKLTYEDDVDADPAVWPYDSPDNEYVNGWMLALPEAKLLLLYDAYIPDP